MTSKKPRRSAEKPGNKSQLERFKEAARQLETDDDEERFNERLKELAKQKPEKGKPDD
ncbi:hypothetical protein [Marinovum algicola]|uniref:hypothetical protein n=1 Tax=Marinovum TaxID=367771 RepID=UPI000A70BDE1|nr:hypothetical protein [Marinovum algicola]